MTESSKNNRAARAQKLISTVTVFCAGLVAILLLTAISLIRSNPMSFIQALSFYQAAVMIAIAGSLVAAASLALSWIRKSPKKLMFSIVCLGICLPVVLAGWAMKSRADRVPKIHDITTDTRNPPQFRALLQMRQNVSVNSAEYGGAEVAALQKEAYPEIQPILTTQPLAESYLRAVEAATRMNWEVVSQDPNSGIIEAVSTSAFFGFKDDVVIRIVEKESKTRIDVRSLSRVGLSDIGANAKRIMAYKKELTALLH